ncbi:hypothetical protein [Bradyrhizobium sp. USDA 3364]
MSQAEITNITSRRRFLAMGGGVAAAALIPTVVSATPAAEDAALVDAAAGVVALDGAIEAFLDANNDDDEHPEFQAMDSQRSAHLDTLATVPAIGIAGLRAKARTLKVDSVTADLYRHQEISLSLVEDLTGGLLS